MKVGKSWWKVGKVDSVRNEGISTFWIKKNALKKFMKFVELPTIF